MKRIDWYWLLPGICFSLVVVFVLSIQVLSQAQREEAISFSRDIEPIFEKYCYQCHGESVAMNGYSLWRRNDAVRGGYSGLPAIIPGDSKDSRLIRLVAGLDDHLVMPPAGPRLSIDEISTLRTWIDEGVSWDIPRSDQLESDLEWLEMEYGPVISASISVGEPEDPRSDRSPGENLAVKAHAVFLKPQRKAGIIFDTELLRYAAGWTDADLILTGTVFDWKHGPYPYLDGDPIFETRVEPGWAHEGGFDDPRPDGIGNLPDDWGEYRGYYRYGEQIVFSYEILGREILDLPDLESWEGLDVITRTIEVGPSTQSVRLCVAALDDDAGHLSPSANSSPDPIQVTRTAVRAGDLMVGFVGNVQARWHWSGERLELEFPSASSERVGRLYITRSDALSFFTSRLERQTVPPSLKPLTIGTAPLYPETVVTKGVLGKEQSAFVIDEIPLPVQNPWKSWMRPGDFAFFDQEDRVTLTTWSGDVWIASGIDADLDQIIWKRFATGFHQPLGVEVVGSQVYVLDRNQITRLHDQNGDGEADFYENFNNDILATQHFHEFTFDLDRDREGNFYFSKAARAGLPASIEHHGVIVKVDSTGENLEVLCRGFRVPNGVAVSDNGEIMTSDQEGQWVPATSIVRCQPGGYYGYAWGGGVRPEEADLYQRPITYLPINFDNSGGGQAWIPDDRWGPFKGHLVHASYGKGKIFLILIEETANGATQGGAVEFPLDFETGLMRPEFRKQDGQLYVTGLRGWSTVKKQTGGFYRVRYTGAPVTMPRTLHVSRENGVSIGFTGPLDREAAETLENYQVRRWNYQRSQRYGSDMYQLSGVPGTESLRLRSARLTPNLHTISLQLEDLREVDQMYINLTLKSAAGDSVVFEILHTVNDVPAHDGRKILAIQE